MEDEPLLETRIKRNIQRESVSSSQSITRSDPGSQAGTPAKKDEQSVSFLVSVK